MLVLPADMKVLVSVAPVDMRKSINGLTMLVVEVLKQNPQSRYLFLFRNAFKTYQCVVQMKFQGLGTC